MNKNEAREKCKTDAMFLAGVLGYDFCDDVHPELFEAFPVKTGAMRDWSPIKNRLVLWPRGHFKTSAVVVEIVQTILCNPDVRILLMQGSLKLTKGWLSEIKAHFTGKDPKSRLKELFPEFCAETLGSADRFTVPARKRTHLKEATVTAASPKAIATGQHYEAFFADDLVHANNYRNVEMLDKLETEFAHFLPLIDPGFYVTVTGTRYSHADIYARIQQRNKGEWLVSIRPCYKPDGTLLFPVRQTKDGRQIGFTPELLVQLQRDDPETFSAQYLNSIISAKNHLFPEAVILGSVKSTKDPEFPASAPSVFVIDLAESKKVESDHSVVAVGKLDGLRRVWVVDCVGGTYSVSQTVNTIIQMALKYRPIRIVIEKSPGATFFVEYLAKVAQESGLILPIELLKTERQKDAKYLRISSLESAFKTKRLFLCAGITDFERLEQEFTQFPRGRHDDRPDVIALLYKYLGGLMTLQPSFHPRTGIASAQRPVLLTDILTRPNEPEHGQVSVLGDTGFAC